jgi:glutathione synthase/RimK-type ligase-like ATP-grasp enzyme
MIIVIGSPEEYHSLYMHDLLKSKGEKVRYFDSRTLPENILLSWNASNIKNKGTIKINGEPIHLENIKSFYWRWYYGINIKSYGNTEEENYTAYMVEREISSAVDSLFASLDCLWVNSIDAITMHKKKSHQLNVMAKNGIRVPNTLITNDKDTINDFIKETGNQCIYKPAQGGAHTTRVKAEDLTEQRLDSLKNSPVQFQEFIDGVDIRVYVIDKDIYAAEIRASTLDFREDMNAEIVPIELPNNIKEDCFKIMKLFNLNFSGIDIRRSINGEYVFIEANPSPMFTHFEQMSGFPISEKLANLLIKGK